MWTKQEWIDYVVDSFCFLCVVSVLLICMLGMWAVITVCAVTVGGTN